MRRRPKSVLFGAALLAIGLGVSIWLIWFPPWGTSALEKRLVGIWKGDGALTGEWSIEIKSNPEHGVPGGRESGTRSSASTIQAEFKDDGSFTWHLHDAGGGMTFDIWLPEKGKEPLRWEVLGTYGNQATIKMGDTPGARVTLIFETKDSFTISFPNEFFPGARGIMTFRRFISKN